MQRPESTTRKEKRLELYGAYRESNQTVAEFCRERGESLWRVRTAIRRTEEESSGNFEEVTLPTGDGGSYRIRLLNGRELSVPQYFNEKRVAQLIRVLETC